MSKDTFNNKQTNQSNSLKNQIQATKNCMGVGAPESIPAVSTTANVDAHPPAAGGSGAAADGGKGIIFKTVIKVQDSL
jgi:hypothetical protein